MYLLRLGVLIMLVLFGAIAALIGAVTMYAALSDGSITYVATSAGAVAATEVAHAVDPGRFWQLFAVFGAIPFGLGLALVWLGLARFRG